MANRNFYRTAQGLLNYDVSRLHVVFDVGASGAPTLKADPQNKGIASVARDSAGHYTITLDDKYNALLQCHCEHFQNGTSDQDLVVKQDDASVSASTPTVQIVCLSGSTPTDPTDGSDVAVTLDLLNSTV